jgi:predicted amino acid racemase
MVSNLLQVKTVTDRQSIGLTVVTKICTSDPHILSCLYDAGVTAIADSNMANFAHTPCGAEPKTYTKSVIKTRLSDIRALPAIPAYARPERVFVSDEAFLEAITALPRDLRPETVFIAELGDLRDGFLLEDIPPLVARYPEVPFAGVSANFGCLSGKMPDVYSITLLHDCAVAAAAVSSKKEPPFVSVGGTVAYPLLVSGEVSGLVAELRMGEGIFFGYDSSAGIPIPGFCRNTFTLYGEIVEIREKFVLPLEHPGYNAFGGHAVPRKTGKRRCAVLDFGILGAAMDDIQPLDTAVTLGGQTFDFTVMDITESSHPYKTGEHIAFAVQYKAAAQALLNPYIARIIR